MGRLHRLPPHRLFCFTTPYLAPMLLASSILASYAETWTTLGLVCCVVSDCLLVRRELVSTERSRHFPSFLECCFAGASLPRLDAFSSVVSEIFSFFHVHVSLGPDPFLPRTTDRRHCRTTLLRCYETALLTRLKLSFLYFFTLYIVFPLCIVLSFILSSFVITSFWLVSLSLSA